MHLVLASSSPRRAALLDAAGIAYRLAPADIDESPLAGEAPDHYVVRLAVEKARAVVRRNPGSLVLGADTTVVVGGQMLGKPDDGAHAEEMLRLLAGRTHQVLTGVAVALGDREISAIERTEVRFLPLTDAEIAWYAASGEPIGKAGAYAIQGLASRFVDRIDGSYSNVVGLPVSLVYQLLTRLGWRDGGPPGGPARRSTNEI